MNPRLSLVLGVLALGCAGSSEQTAGSAPQAAPTPATDERAEASEPEPTAPVAAPVEAPPDEPPPQRRPTPVAARVLPVSDPEPERIGTYDGPVLTGGSHMQQGLPARSEDGSLIAIVDHGGDGYASEDRLLSLDARDASEERVYALAYEDPDTSELDGRARSTFERERRARIERADRFLRRRGFQSLTPIPGPEEPRVAGVPTLDFDRESGEVTITGLDGRRLYAGVLHPALRARVPQDPDDANFDYCANPQLDEARAWLLDDTRALLRSTVNPPADTCEVIQHYAIVDLTGE